MSFALLRKELREHGWVLGAMVFFAGLALAGHLVNAGDQGGRFAALIRFTAGIGSLSALVTANRLFAREYSGKTQLFLEVLPITRTRVIVTKWIAGAVFQCGLIATAWFVTLEYQRASEVITLEDASHALLAMEAFTLALWSFAAMAGLLGRYRYVAWMAFWSFFFFFDSVGSVKPFEAPLLRLLNDASGMARTPVPLSALLEAAVVVVISVVGTAALALSGSGAIAATLAKRMTARERVFIIASAVVIATLSEGLKKERELPPFELAKATRSNSSRGVVGVMTTEDVDEPKARSIGENVAHDVDSLSDALKLKKKLPVFLLPQRGLDPTLTQRAELSGSDGIVLRAAPDADQSMLRARVIHELLTDETDFRARKEDRHALLDGFAVWWAVQDDEAERERWWRRAASSEVPLSRTTITRWDETSERLGECVTNAAAFALVDTLFVQVGKERALTLAQRLFAAPHKGLAALLFEDSPSALLKAAGTDWDTITAEAERRRLEYRGKFGEHSERTATVAIRGSDDGNVVKVEVKGLEKWTVQFGKLGPWSRGQTNLRRIDVRGAVETLLPVTLARGDLLLATVDYDDAELACPVRIAAQRLEAP